MVYLSLYLIIQRRCKSILDKTPIIKGINGPELVDLILKYYDVLYKEDAK